MAVPYTFGSATASIPLSQLDSNFATTITLGNTAVQLGNTITSLTGVSNVASATSLSLGSNGNTTAVTIDTSQNVGIGTSSPNASLQIYKSGASASSAYFTNGTTTTSSGFQVGLDSGSNAVLNMQYNAQMLFSTNNTERMRIDSSGNVGIGTSSPSSYGKLAINGNTAILNGGSLYLNNTGNTAYAFIGSPATNVIGFNNSTLGESMRIDSSGNLLVGSSTGTDGRIKVDGTGNANNCAVWAKSSGGAAGPTYVCWNAFNTGNNDFIDFYTETSATLRGNITYNRTAGLTAYNTTSDYRSKDIISPVLDSGDVIDSVPVYIGKMKGATQARPMFIAHETPDYAHTGEKDAVDKDGKPVYQQMDASSLVPVLWAEVQSLRKRLAILESK